MRMSALFLKVESSGCTVASVLTQQENSAVQPNVRVDVVMSLGTIFSDKFTVIIDKNSAFLLFLIEKLAQCGILNIDVLARIVARCGFSTESINAFNTKQVVAF